VADPIESPQIVYPSIANALVEDGFVPGGFVDGSFVPRFPAGFRGEMTDSIQFAGISGDKYVAPYLL
jgi:hypothetical protein